MNQKRRVGGKKTLNRKKIIAATKELFDKDGIDKVTFTDIADAVDMSRSTIFNYFATKEELIQAIIQQEINHLQDFAETQEETGVEFIFNMFDFLTDKVCQHPNIMIKLIHGDPIKGENNILNAIHKCIEGQIPGETAEKKRLMLISLIGTYHGLLIQYWHSTEDNKGELIKQDYRKLVRPLLEKEI